MPRSGSKSNGEERTYRKGTCLAWLGQVIAAVILVLDLVLTYRTFRFSTFVYLLVFFHLLLLLYGAHYTYSENPLFHFLKEQFGWQRNYFDRVGHFAQGFVPAFLETFTTVKWEKINFLCLYVTSRAEIWSDLSHIFCSHPSTNKGRLSHPKIVNASRKLTSMREHSPFALFLV